MTLDQDWTFRVQRFQALAPDRKFFPAAGGEKFPPNGWLGGDCTGFFFGPPKNPLRNSGFRNYFPNLAQIFWKGGEGSRWWKRAIRLFSFPDVVFLDVACCLCFGLWKKIHGMIGRNIFEMMKDIYIYICIQKHIYICHWSFLKMEERK